MFRLCITLLLLAPVSARAADDAPPPAAAVQLAHLVLPQTKYNEMLDNVAQVTTRSLQARAQEGEQLPPHFTDRFEVELRQMLQYDDLIQLHAKLIAQQYTAREIKELIAFYQTPLGQKSVEVMPRIMATWTQEVQKRMEAGMPVALQRIFPPKKSDAPAPKADK